MDFHFSLVAPKPHRAPEPLSKSTPNSRHTTPNKSKTAVAIKANHALALQALARNHPHANEFGQQQPMQRSTPMSIQVSGNGGVGVVGSPGNYSKRTAGSFSAGHSPTLSPTMSPLSSSPSTFAFNSSSPRLKERNSKLIFAQGVPHFAREHNQAHFTLGIGMGMALGMGGSRRDSLDEHELATREIQHIMTTTSQPISIPPGGRASISGALAAQAAASKQLQLHPQNNYSLHAHNLPHALQLPIAATHGLNAHSHGLNHAGRHSPLQSHLYHGYAHALSNLPHPVLHHHHLPGSSAATPPGVIHPHSPSLHPASLGCSPALAAMSPPVRSHNPVVNDARFHFPDEFEIERREHDIGPMDADSVEVDGDVEGSLDVDSFDPDSFDHFDQFDPVSVSMSAEMAAERENSAHQALTC